MSCEIAQEEMMLALYGELDAAALRELELHVERCEECQVEWKQLATLHGTLKDFHGVAEPSPNLLAASRMRLDEALDASPGVPWVQRLLGHSMRWLGYVSGAPALTTLLVGAGFLGGDFLARYQAIHGHHLPDARLVSGQGVVSSISGITQLPNSQLVQVNYNRVVPEAIQGSLDDPQIRQMLMLGTTSATEPSVHDVSVDYLSKECRAEHGCGGEDPAAEEYRGALLATLKTDRNQAVRLKALEGLQPYVAGDQRVRDAVLAALMHDKSPEVRTEAISMLGPVGADSSVREVLRSVSSQDANPAIRNASFRVLQGAADIE